MNIALLARVSTQEQAINGHSIGEQIERMHKYCEAMGWTVYKEYTDAGYSGANTDRPALQRMIRDIKAGKIDKVLVYKLDRLSRSQKDTLYLIEDVFLANNTDFVSMSENFDTSTPFGRAMIGILAVFAQLEREQIKERMQMGKEARAKEGKFSGGRMTPIGYDYINGELLTNEYEKMQVLKIIDLFLSGTSLREITFIMNSSGYKHKHGKWNTKTIREMLKAKTFLGYIKYNQEWHKGTHEEFIDVETHEKICNLLEERAEKHKNGGRRAKITSYLGGLLFCKNCGAKLTKIKAGKMQNSYYICNSRAKKVRELIKDENCKLKYWRMEKLDALVFDEIKKLAVDPAYFDKMTENSPIDERPDLIEKEIEKLDNQVSKLMDLYTMGNMPIKLLDKKLNEINEQKLKLEHELENIFEDNRKLSKEETFKTVQSFGEILERGEFNEIRLVIETLIDHIDVEEEDITIYWNFA